MSMSDLRALRERLTDLSVLGDPATLRKKADAERAAEGPPQQAGQYDATAEGGALWPSIDPKCRLISADVSTSWRGKLAPERFADALFAAYQSAVRRALAAALAAPRPRPAAPVTPPRPDYDLGSTDIGTWLDDFLADMRERRAAPANVYADLDTVREVRSPNGYLTLRLRGGVLVGVTGSVPGLRSANPNLLRQDLLAVFREANLTADR